MGANREPGFGRRRAALSSRTSVDGELGTAMARQDRKAAGARAAKDAFPFGEVCPVARALAVVGERWAILVLRDLFLHGPRRFQDFESSLEGISPNTLSARLKTLEEHGLVARRLYETHPPRAEYVLTDKGRALRPVLKALREWGETYVPAPGRRRAPPGPGNP